MACAPAVILRRKLEDTAIGGWLDRNHRAGIEDSGQSPDAEMRSNWNGDTQASRRYRSSLYAATNSPLE